MKHWFLFVFGIYYLMSESVSERKDRESNACLRMFVLMTERLYGIRHCTFNVHSLIHFVQSVINTGPLWATSTFVFEGYNRTLIRCFHGTQKVGFQICETFSLMKVMTELAVSCMEENTDVSVLYTSLASRHTKSKCTNVLSNNLRALGKGEQVILPPSKLLAASRLTGNQVHTSAIVYKRFIFHHQLYTSSDYFQSARHCNCYVAFTHGVYKYGRIETFLCVKLGPDCMNDNGFCLCDKANIILVKPFSITRRPLFVDARLGCSSDFLVNIDQHADNPNICIYPGDILQKCIFMKTDVSSYLCPLPSQFYWD
ncbi:uncharacterized protein LOC117527216 [Thalassophryne amazonica]|uniref:uncharacterized protein LOC117527216 n=1 Tax=Thalassophryne amazonica TaxID=390379 RepID=UPI0014711F70|nr:uncharacterized protein LOC117527216 [Thalassophryne amazonica]